MFSVSMIFNMYFDLCTEGQIHVSSAIEINERIHGCDTGKHMLKFKHMSTSTEVKTAHVLIVKHMLLGGWMGRS